MRCSHRNRDQPNFETARFDNFPSCRFPISRLHWLENTRPLIPDVMTQKIDPAEGPADLELAQAANVDALYQRYAHRGLALLASMNLNRADAEDMHQLAWLRVIESFQKIQAQGNEKFTGNFRAWLFQIIRNTAIDHFRKKRPDLIDGELASQTFFADAPPDAALIETEYQQSLQRCLSELTTKARSVIQARLMGDDYETIAASLNLEAARLHRIFFDAKKSVAECLRKSGASE